MKSIRYYLNNSSEIKGMTMALQRENFEE